MFYVNVINANCWAHARKFFSDAVKIADKKEIVSKETVENAFTSYLSTVIFLSNSYCLAISVTSLYMLYAHSKGLQS